MTQNNIASALDLFLAVMECQENVEPLQMRSKSWESRKIEKAFLGLVDKVE